MRAILWGVSLLAVLWAGGAGGHEIPTSGDTASGAVGLTENTGQFLPPDLVFSDETGAKVKLSALLGKPAILTLVYYTCEHICPLMLGGLSQAIPRLAMTPGSDYRLITVSFDAADTPGVARDIKKNYTRAAGTRIAPGGWTFLVGDQANIDSLTRAVGFTYKKELHGFNHPVVLIFLSPAGKISQYLQVTKYGYGADLPVNFSSFDLNMGLIHAARGKEVSEVTKAILYCFSHEPPGQSRFFDFLAVVGLVTLAAMAAFLVYLAVTTRRYRKGKEYDIER